MPDIRLIFTDGVIYSRSELSKRMRSQLQIVKQTFHISDLEFEFNCNRFQLELGPGAEMLVEDVNTLMSLEQYVTVLENAYAKVKEQARAIPSLTANNRTSLYGALSFNDGKDGCEQWVERRREVLNRDKESIKQQLVVSLEKMQTLLKMTSPRQNKVKEKVKRILGFVGRRSVSEPDRMSTDGPVKLEIYRSVSAESSDSPDALEFIPPAGFGFARYG